MTTTSPVGLDHKDSGVAPRSAKDRKDHRVVVMTALGVVSGILSTLAFVIVLSLWGPSPMQDFLPGSAVGIIFGGFIGAYLWRLGLATGARAAGFAFLSLISCNVTLWFVFEFRRLGLIPNVESTSWQVFITIEAAGIVGAGLLVTSVCALFPFFRKPGPCLVTVLAGGAAAALIGYSALDVGLFSPGNTCRVTGDCPPDALSPAFSAVKFVAGLPVVLAFPIWQTAVAFSLARALPKTRPE